MQKLLRIDENDYFNVEDLEKYIGGGFRFRQYCTNKKSKILIDKIIKSGARPHITKTKHNEAKTHALIAIFCLQERGNVNILDYPFLIEILGRNILQANKTKENLCTGALWINHNKKQRLDLVLKSLPKLSQDEYKILANLAYTLQNTQTAISVFRKIKEQEADNASKFI